MRGVARERFTKMALDRFDDLGGISFITNEYGNPSNVIPTNSIVLPVRLKMVEEKLGFFLSTLPVDVRVPLRVLSTDTVNSPMRYYIYDLQHCSNSGCKFDPEHLTEISRDLFDRFERPIQNAQNCKQRVTRTILNDKWYSYVYVAELMVLFDGACAPTRFSLQIVDPARFGLDRFVRGMNGASPPYLTSQAIRQKNLVLERQ